MSRSKGDAIIGGGLDPTPGPRGRLSGLCSNIKCLTCTIAILVLVLLGLIMSLVLGANCSTWKDSSHCPLLEPCPGDWLYHQRKCYFFSEEAKDWKSSQSFCSTHNSSLVVIENQQELNFIMKITKQNPWIGLHKKGERFIWVNGTALDTNVLTVKASGECAYIDTDVLSSSGCMFTRGWICKKTS
ncbi:C-type lectin domain family 2 member L-like [Carettochelys insculpta]|uniref:C-type lectin domain family 2 member L-like n=1 Tax=Carettochelys insculpta TaxID=44489 RepID=UPI003EBA865B